MFYKICSKCKSEKLLEEFGVVKSGKNAGRHQSYCKQCYRRLCTHKICSAWGKVYKRIQARCKYDKNNYYYKHGIKCLLNHADIKELWFRDNADKMTDPVIHRNNSLGNYTKENCRFVENLEHKNLHKKCEV